MKAFIAGVLAVLLSLSLGMTARAQTLDSWSLSLPTHLPRGDLGVQVNAPATGDRLPILLFSHGSGYSKDDYGPLARYWAAHGFVVLQPTHLDARVLNLAANDPRRATIWRSRRDDLVYLLDHVADIERLAPALRGRLDTGHVVVAGHSFGGHTASLLLGARAIDPATGAGVDLSDARVSAGVLIAPPGGYADLPPDWQARSPYLKMDWSGMRRPVLVIIGSADTSTMNPKDYLWRGQAYEQAPAGAACRLTLEGVGHFMGGIGGGDQDHPADVITVQKTSLDWLTAGAAPIKSRIAAVNGDVHAPDQLSCK